MPLDGRRPLLTVYVVWHPLAEHGAEQAERLFTWLCADPDRPATRGLGIPVRFRTSTDRNSYPPAVPYDSSEQTVVVVLVDDNFVADGWQPYFEALLDGARAPQHLLIPVAATSNAFNLGARAREANFLRLFESPESERDLVLLNCVTRALCRVLSGNPKVKIFLSHSKEDGVEITRSVQHYLHTNAGLANFFDATDIPEGSNFADVISAEVTSSAVLLALYTDSYGSREWCRLEVLVAKRRHVPVVVLAAVEQGEVRAFPYLGNVAVVRWQGATSVSLARLTNTLLREALRARYFPARVELLRQLHGLTHGQTFIYPPELLSALLVRKEAQGAPCGLYLYPDPPLGSEELELLREFDPSLEPLTPTQLVAR